MIQSVTHPREFMEPTGSIIPTNDTMEVRLKRKDFDFSCHVLDTHTNEHTRGVAKSGFEMLTASCMFLSSNPTAYLRTTTSERKYPACSPNSFSLSSEVHQ